MRHVTFSLPGCTRRLDDAAAVGLRRGVLDYHWLDQEAALCVAERIDLALEETDVAARPAVEIDRDEHEGEPQALLQVIEQCNLDAAMGSEWGLWRALQGERLASDDLESHLDHKAHCQ